MTARFWAGAAAPALMAALMAAGTASAQGAAREAGDCEALRNAVLEAAHVTTARVVGAVEEGPYGALPAYCEVRVRALPAISVEVRLPMEGWNGGLYQTGCGGFCGILGREDAQGVFINAMGPGLARGYATATSDSGHHGLSVVDATWASANPQGERDWGWRSVPETNRAALALIDAFYGEALSGPAIFQGCSTGGRMAMRAALDGPEMFDGIIAGAPAMDYPGLVGTKMAYLLQANADADGEPILGPGKEALIHDAVLAQCDAADGAEDGAIADPRACEADLSGLACEAGGEGEGCLTEAEMGVVEAWRQGPRNEEGVQLYPGGVPAGSEPFWPLWLTGTPEGAPPLLPAFAGGFGAYMAFEEDPGPSYDPLAFDLDEDPARMARAAETYNADDPDLSAFADAGGRMLVWHGWADPLVTPFKTVEWHEAVGATIGEEARDEAVSLHMIPGLDHCGLLPGPDGIDQTSLDPLGALERWLETGEAPGTILREAAE